MAVAWANGRASLDFALLQFMGNIPLFLICPENGTPFHFFSQVTGNLRGPPRVVIESCRAGKPPTSTPTPEGETA